MYSSIGTINRTSDADQDTASEPVGDLTNNPWDDGVNG